MTQDRTIAVDVDGTLFAGGKINERLVAWLAEKKSQGFVLILWSARGAEYAGNAAALCPAGLLSVIISKPGFIVDDTGWGWIRYTKVVWPHA